MDISKFRAPKKDHDEDAWAEWLDEKPAQPQPAYTAGFKRASDAMRGPQATRKHRSATSTQKQKHTPSTGSGDISISIHMPRIQKATLQKAWRRSWPWLAGSVAVVGLLYGGNYLMEYLNTRKDTQGELLPVNTRAAVELGYKPIVPDVSDREAGAAIPSDPVYYAEQKVYSFTDKYDGVNITVDQQALPDSFRDNSGAILSVAESINATENFTTTLGTVYMFTSPNSGAQRLVLANDKMLMFLQSTTKLETSDWVTYIQSLR